MNNKNEILLYQTEKLSTRIEVRVEEETVWLNRQQISMLFNRDVKTIGKHINNVFYEGELDGNATVANFAIVQNEGDRKVERQIEHYNLDLIRTAKHSIILIDNYIDDSVLTHFVKRKKNVGFSIFTKSISKQLKLDIEKHNQQYNPIKIKKFTKAHDRFLIIDETTVYHFGASLKDLGKKWFAFSKMDISSVKVLDKLKEEGLI